VFTDIVDFKIDPAWHEFENIEYTNEPANTTLNLLDFIKTIEEIK
jgi:hypothetical protein